MDFSAPAAAAPRAAAANGTTPNEQAPNEQAPNEQAMTTPNTEAQWFIAREGKQYGPLSDQEMQKLVELGHLKPADLVWRPGFADWRPAGSLMQQPKPAPAPLPAPPAAMQPRLQHPQSAAAPAPVQPMPSQPAPASAAQRLDQLTAGRGPATGGRAAPAPQPGPMQNPAAGPLPGGPGAMGMPSMGGRAPQPMQPQPAGARPYTGPQHPGGPGPGYPSAQPGPQPGAMTAGGPTTAGRRPIEATGRPLDMDEDSAAPNRGRKRTFAAAAIVLFVAAGAGLLLSKKGVLPNVANVTADGSGANSRVAPLGNLAESTDEIDANFQRTPLWIVVKKEFPEWYGERLKEVAKLNAEKQPEDAVAKRLTEALVQLRRQNADKALSASMPKLKDVATAFLGNLKALSAKSTEACYNFISQGETSPAVIEMMRSPDQNSAVQAQVAAIFEAIAEGRKSPVAHSTPVKSDYDALADQLTKLGWTQADLQLFADSKSLAKAKPEKVCKMVQDWFIAHIGIQDAGVQERLLVETLRPVVAG